MLPPELGRSCLTFGGPHSEYRVRNAPKLEALQMGNWTSSNSGRGPRNRTTPGTVAVVKPAAITEPTPDAKLDSKVKIWIAVLGLAGVLAGVGATLYVANNKLPPDKSAAVPVGPVIHNLVTPNIVINNNNLAPGPIARAAPAIAATAPEQQLPFAAPLPRATQRSDLYGCLPKLVPYSLWRADYFVAALNNSPQALDDALYWLARTGQTACVRGFIAAGVRPDGYEAVVNGKVQGTPPLVAAVQESQLETVRALLEDGANPNLVTLAKEGDRGLSTLTQAVIFLPEAVPFILAKNVDVNYVDDLGTTALYLAASRGYAPIVKALLARGAQKDVRWNGLTALEAARRNKHDDVAALLEAK